MIKGERNNLGRVKDMGVISEGKEEIIKKNFEK